MKKIILFLLFSFFFCSFSLAEEEIEIISREEWGANEDDLLIGGEAWQAIFSKPKSYTHYQPTAQEIQAQKEKREKRIKIYNYLSEYFPEDVNSVQTDTYLNEQKLYWKTEKTKYVKNILIHHTDTETSGDYKKDIQDIFKFHAFSRGWGDIGYNFIIDPDGKIYEGRYGGDYTPAAHTRWNNHSSLGIALLGDYAHEKINAEQYNSLKNFIAHLSKKYGIDINKQGYFHKECIEEGCDAPIISFYDSHLSAHRDAGHTDCPGDALYEQMHQIRKELLFETTGRVFLPYIPEGEVNYQKIYESTELKKKVAKLSEKMKNFSQKKRGLLLKQVNRKMTAYRSRQADLKFYIFADIKEQLEKISLQDEELL